jgi:hypothetical protein
MLFTATKLMIQTYCEKDYKYIMKNSFFNIFDFIF